MAMFAPKVAVQPPARQPLPYGLFSVFQPQSSADRWLAGGAAWEALTCEPALGLPVGTTEQTGPDTHNFATGRGIEGEAQPFTILGYFEDTLLTSTDAEAEAKAEEHLLLQEQRRVEEALWTGNLQNFPNLSTEDDESLYAPPTDLGIFSPLEAIAELEEYLGDVLGFQGVLHVPRHLASRLASKGFIEARGGRMFTKLETPVVVGSGYDGDRIVVTPPIFGYRSEVTSWVTADIQKNNRLATASRDYILGFDPCGSAQVDVLLGTSSDGPSEVTITGSTAPLPVSVEGTQDVNVTNQTVPVSGSVALEGTSDVNVTNDPLRVETVADETPEA